MTAKKNYDKFLEDSSDDYPKYGSIEHRQTLPYDAMGDYSDFMENKSECSDDSPLCSDSFIIKQTDDEANYSEAYGQSSVNRSKNTEEIKIAIHNILELAREQTKIHLKDCIEADKKIAEESIIIVEEFLVNYCDTNIGLALSEKRVDNA